MSFKKTKIISWPQIHNTYVFLHPKIFWGTDRKMPEVQNGKMQFSFFRPTFGPILTNFIYFRPTFGLIWTNFTCFRQKFVQIGPKIGLKHENCIFPFWTSEFSCRCPKKFFECIYMATKRLWLNIPNATYIQDRTTDEF